MGARSKDERSAIGDRGRHRRTSNEPLSKEPADDHLCRQQGTQADTLIAVTSPAASQVQVVGTTDIPPGATVISTGGSALINTPPTSPLVAGRLRITLTLNRVLRDGLNIPVTFQFQHAGTVTLSVPTGARSDVISSG